MGKSIIFLIAALLFASPSWGRMNVAMLAGGPAGVPPTTPVITATPGDTTNTITLTSGDVGALTNVLYWDTTSRATYDLYANSIDNATLVAASFPGTPYVHSGRTNGVPYYYMLRGTDVAGSTSSAEVSGTPAAGGGELAFHAINAATSGAAASTTIVSNTINIPSGGYVVCAIASTQTVSGVTCGGNTLVAAAQSNIGDGVSFQYPFDAWHLSNAAASTGTCTATFSTSAEYRAMKCASYTGVAASSPLDTWGCNNVQGDYTTTLTNTYCNNIEWHYVANTATSSYTTAPYMTTNANDLLIAIVLRWDDTATWTAAANWTERGTDGELFGFFDRVVTSTGTYPGEYVATASDTNKYVSLFLALKKQ